MTGQVLRLGTRGSALAMVQARAVATALETKGIPVRLVTIETDGDRRAPDTAWGEGAFVAAIERALIAGHVDAGVHSAKDLPTRFDERLTVAAFLTREDPRDALVTRDGGATLATLARGARVGTDSPRRAGFLLAARPDLLVHPLNGNVDTRLRRLDAGESDALCLAVAGLCRLGRADRIDEYLPAEVVPPAPGQGAIAVQVRSEDPWAVAAIGAVDDRTTRLAVEAERAFLHASGGGCRAPIGALATVAADDLVLLGGYARPDGSAVATAAVRGPAADGERLGRELAGLLGARLPSVARELAFTGRVLVTRTVAQSDALVAALSTAGLEPVVVPAIAIEPVPPGGALDRALAGLGGWDWVLVTSANAADAVGRSLARVGTDPHAARWAAVGQATADALAAAGIAVDHRPSRADAASLAAGLPLRPGDRVLLPRTDIADGGLPDALRARGAVVEVVVAYHTVEAPIASKGRLAEALGGRRIEAIVLTSGSTARGLLALAGDEHRDTIRRIPAVCLGAQTAAEARRLGYAVVTESPMQAADRLAALIVDVVRSDR